MNFPFFIFIFPFLIFLYYLIVWYLEGNDEDFGTIIPVYSPPDDLSPADIRYIWKKRYDAYCFFPFLFDLYYQGVIDLKRGGDRIVKVIIKDKKKLKKEEIGIFQGIEEGQEFKVCNRPLDLTYRKIDQRYKRFIRKKNRKLFHLNQNWLALGLIFSFFGAVIIYISQFGFEAKTYLMFLNGFLLAFIVSAIILSVYKRKYKGLIGLLVMFLIFSMVSFIENDWNFFYAIPIFVPLMVMNYYFYHALPKYNKKGIQIINKILGFRMFLEKSQKGRFKHDLYYNQFIIFNKPPKNENFLTYLIALEIE